MQRQRRFALAGFRPQRMDPGLESAEQAIPAEEAGGDFNRRASFLNGLPARDNLLEDLEDERGSGWACAAVGASILSRSRVS
jgi:hypothetical protein